MDCFVDRTDKLDELTQRLQERRLVSVVGIGGSGKTRLVYEFATRVQDSGEFPDGVWIAELDSVIVSDDEAKSGKGEEGVYQAILTALDAPGQATRTPLKTLLEYVQDKSLLLVLDNCEHLGRTAGKLALTLLRAARDLRIIATSRLQLGAAGEAVIRMDQMTLPPQDAPLPADPVGQYEAVDLFCSLVEARITGFRLTKDNWDDVVTILRRVDGIPLAIKLVTVRLGTMGLKELLARMDNLFAVLNKSDELDPDQHETLEAVFRWNFENSEDSEKLLWARASVFAGTFTLAAAEQVCADDELPREQIYDALHGLIMSSTVEVTNEERTRFRLLVPLKEFGATLLDQRGERDTLLQQRRAYFMSLAARAASTWYGPAEYDVLNALADDLPNFDAVQHAYVEDPDPDQSGLQIAVNLAQTRLYFKLGRMRESVSWLGRTLAATADPRPELEIGARALDLFVDLCTGADAVRVRQRLDELKQIAGAYGQPSPVVWFSEGVARFLLLDYDLSAMPLLDQAYDALRAAGPETYGDAAMALLLKTIGETLMADKHRASAAATRLTAETEIAGSPWMIRWAQWCAANVECRFGQPARAAAQLEAMLRDQKDGVDADSWLPMWIIEVLAWTAVKMRAGHRAAVLLGIASAINKITNTNIDTILPFRDSHVEAVKTVKQLLGEANYQTAFAYGAQIRNITEARRAALGHPVDHLDLDAATDVIAGAETWDLLTDAQKDVAVLIARGLTNKRIAEMRLSSIKTIDSHVADIRQRAGIEGGGRSALVAGVLKFVPPALLDGDDHH
ncbi:NB-ARC domain-containing protein [Lentzea sp. NPDC042327]|uniref:ATP-binding protein n=1 Tax=Lentzea sp. NPDC042327 TaxID=3154801 RepID=UPI003402471D